MHCVQKDENSCELKSVESTDLSQRLIHGEVCTEAGKEAVWRITASECYRDFTTCASSFGSVCSSVPPFFRGWKFVRKSPFQFESSFVYCPQAGRLFIFVLTQKRSKKVKPKQSPSQRFSPTARPGVLAGQPSWSHRFLRCDVR